MQGCTGCVNMKTNCIWSVLHINGFEAHIKVGGSKLNFLHQDSFCFHIYIYIFILKAKLLFEQNWQIFHANMSLVNQICARFNGFFKMFFFQWNNLWFFMVVHHYIQKSILFITIDIKLLSILLNNNHLIW